jgi:hypoxanthine phosphoribosyltransferase
MSTTMKSTRKKILSWNNYLQLVNRLYRKINWKEEEFDAIVAINRGGNIIGTILSHKTRLQLDVINKDQVIGRRGKVLIVTA